LRCLLSSSKPWAWSSLDSEYYCKDVIEYLEQRELRWSMAADKDESVKELIKVIPEDEWRAFMAKDGIGTDREVAETVHSIDKSTIAFRLIAMRWQEKQLNFFMAQRHLVMPEGWRSKTIKSIRWLLVEAGGKLIKHGRALTLKIAASMEKYRIYLEMRRRTYELMLG